MKKYWCVLVVVLSLVVAPVQIVAEDKGELDGIVKNHLIKTGESFYKKPIKREVTFIDERTGDSETWILNGHGYIPGKDTFDEESLAAFAANLASGIDQPMRNPTITVDGKIIPGQSRIILSEQELVEKIQGLTYADNELVLPIYETVPTVTEEDLKTILDVKVGEYTTYFNPSVEGRSVNIKLSSDAIQHHVLGPGDRFSFNGVVGQRTRERGYREAKEIVNKEFVMGIGGGICQTSSTLFNAIDQAGLDVVERYSHSREIGYVPANRDATVSWGGPDFKFVNPYPYPVIIKTDVSLKKGSITVSVHSSQTKDVLLASR